MCAHVPLQVKRVVEAFAAVPARVSLDKAVALQVSSQHALEWEDFMANGTLEVSRAGGRNLETRQGEKCLREDIPVLFISDLPAVPKD